MSSSSVYISPKPSTVEITRFVIAGMNVRLFQNAVVSVDLYSGDKFIKNELIALTTEEYNSWLLDEDIVSLVCDKLEFVVTPPPETNNVEELPPREIGSDGLQTAVGDVLPS